MKHLLFICTLMVFCFPAMAKAEINIFACEPEWAALAKEIGKDNVSVTAATRGTEDPHHVRAKPSLLAAMRKANVVFCTGAGLEAGWMPVLMQQAAGAAVQNGAVGNFMASDYIALMDKPQRVDRSMGDVHPEGNPHIQTDPRNILVVGKAFTERLSQLDAAHASAYQANLADFTSRWQVDMKKWGAIAAKLRGTPVVVYHDEWNYLNRWLGLKEIITLEVKPGIPPTPSHLQDVLAASKNADVKVIMLSPFDDEQAAEWLKGQMGAKIVKLPFTVGGIDGTDTLEATFDRTLQALEGGTS
ncbi:MAG: zinc ABC transporter substrate-binding protein [Proteobacteria bacterium]|nr:zinc ABC transporter substrate-binding protein [Pseudomonadota bacterium]